MDIVIFDVSRSDGSYSTHRVSDVGDSFDSVSVNGVGEVKPCHIYGGSSLRSVFNKFVPKYDPLTVTKYAVLDRDSDRFVTVGSVFSDADYTAVSPSLFKVIGKQGLWSDFIDSLTSGGSWGLGGLSNRWVLALVASVVIVFGLKTMGVF